MKFDANLRPLRLADVSTEAARYEEMGFDGVWSFESAHDPFLPLAQAALNTTKLGIGTNIAVAFARSPFATAQTAWDLQAASGGRMVLGLGTQVRAHVERRFSMQFEHPAARVTDYIDCVRAIWKTYQTGERPSHEGPFYRFSLINDFFNAGPIDHPDIPIYLAGVNERMCRAAGEVADGFQAHPMHSAAYIQEVIRPELEAGAKKRDRNANDIAIHIPTFVVMGETEAERSAMEQSVRRQISFYASTPSYRRFLEFHGFQDIGRPLSDLMRRGELDEMPKMVPDALVEIVTLWGNGAELGAQLKARVKAAGAARASLYHNVSPNDPVSMWKDIADGYKAA